MEYKPRVADAELDECLKTAGAVLIDGPKACGKTTTAVQRAATQFRLDEDAESLAALAVAPQLLFDRPTPILFDEWQVAPMLWNRVRRQVDDQQQRGLYILTGSATPRDDASRHSGAGRFASLRMRPMSLYESGHSSGAVSLSALLEGEPQSALESLLDVPGLMERIVIGGWPALLGSDPHSAQRWVTDYLAQIVDVDIPSLGHQRNPERLSRLLQSLARNVGQAPKLSSIERDVGRAERPIASEVLTGYLEALDRLMLGDNSPAWAPHMRSGTRLRSAPVRYFVDPSIATAALKVGPQHLMRDLNAAGFHFEGLAIRDLRVYSQPLGGHVYSWRDANGHEIDAIVSLRGGGWGAFEVKLNPAETDGAAASLLRFAHKVDTDRVGSPQTLGVITSTGMAYRRKDGVQVIPISTLGP
jgi:predicted AAA+ superfamily ATPase